MKWKSHIAIGAVYGFATAKYDFAIIGALTAGSVLPDVIDRFISMGNETLWKKVHRKTSHWWLIYIFSILISAYFGMSFVYFFLIGALLHIYADALTVSGVPFINPLKAGYGLKEARTGKISEVVFAGIMIGVIFIAGVFNGFCPVWFSLTILFIIIVIANPKAEIKKKEDKQQIALETLSGLWTGKKQVADIRNLTENKPEQIQKQAEIVFNKYDFTLFYKNHVAGLPAEKIIEAVMRLLDEKGDCPSVVNRSTDVNPYSEPSTYAALSKVYLWRHSLNVAEEVLKLVKNPGAYSAQLLLAAFGHDIGKSEALDKAMYSMGDHPRISVLLLNGIEGFSELSYKTDVETAILSHHRTGGGELADLLREADRNARRKELASVLPQLDVADVYAPQEHNKQSQQSDRIFGTVVETQDEKRPSEAELSWLDIDKFIVELDSKINVINGKRFDAFSMPDNVVYFQTDLLWKILKKLSRESFHEEVLLADADQDQRRNYLFTVTEMLRERRLIADGLIKNGYFSAPFTVEFKDGSSFKKAFYTPLVSEAFGDVSELESRKSGILKEIVTVKPKYGEES
ncbi:MAG: metal-dependent hydrolase [Deferribacterales bacterium]